MSIKLIIFCFCVLLFHTNNSNKLIDNDMTEADTKIYSTSIIINANNKF